MKVIQPATPVNHNGIRKGNTTSQEKDIQQPVSMRELSASYSSSYSCARSQ